ncbi:GTP-binding protein EngB [hydrothermal vent metagenome]|uniref:GTP-binding protein EngB n=1 Tax=hydrothermal vent metagenome TaxID=652676 RepID=A0A1W1E2Z3_9ZZZZ
MVTFYQELLYHSKIKMTNFYHRAKFLLSCPSLKHCPEDQGYEVIFAGRSNAGKSSAINTVTEQKKLAKVSRTPGRTQHLVFFELDEDRRLVDLPGYGYAKVPEAVKRQWQVDMGEYFAKRKCLTGAVLVMDVRRPLTPFDQMMLDWCVNVNLPTQIILTKSDKVKKGAASNSLMKVKRAIEPYPYVQVQLFSSLKKQGLDLLSIRLNTFFAHVD